MKIIVSIFLSTVILFSSFGQSMLFFHYLINESYYISLCENKARPKMHCNGKCHLAKEMKEQEKHQKAPWSNNVEKSELMLFCQEMVSPVATTPKMTKAEFPAYEDVLSIGFRSQIFHPPLS
ncbi:MAG: hypothetical protein HS118_08925 [Bacteroidia bacterium]|nr:hypothetical protein [Bacteroidia bacterium]MCB8931765.1 hypothetical protein [Bacteroidia bacterium]MCW5932558.1 hypothetical protein [Bacteroidota bacterium]